MAAAFTVLSVEPTQERVTPTKWRAVRIVYAIATESGVQFWMKVLPQNYNTAYINQRGTVLAEKMNTLDAKPGVVGVRVLEDTDPSDRLTQVVVVTVESNSGNSQDDVTLSWDEAQGPAGYAKVEAVRDHLNDIEAL